MPNALKYVSGGTLTDEWERTLPDGRVVVYTMNIEGGAGGTIMASVGSVNYSMAVGRLMAREEVEIEFKQALANRS